MTRKAGISAHTVHWRVILIPGRTTSSRSLVERSESAITAALVGNALLLLVVAIAAVGFTAKALSADGWSVMSSSWAFALSGVVAGAAVGQWLLYRFLCRGRRGVDAVLCALTAVHEGEPDLDAVRVSEQFGGAAEAWNALVAELAESRRRSDAGGAADGDTPSTGPSNDLVTACDMLAQGIVLVTRSKTIEYANGAAARFLGVGRSDLVGRPVEEVVSDDALARSLMEIAAGQTTRRMITERTAHGADDGDDTSDVENYLRYIARPVRHADDAAAMLIIEDITQHRLAERARHAFVAHATHELRTPLTNIRAYAETAIDDGAKDEQTLGECLNVINSEVLRLERLVNDLLSVSEIESGGRQLKQDDVQLRTLLEELRDDFGAQAAERQIELVFELPAKLPAIQGDRDKIALTFHNLLGNSLKYTPDGGTVTVKVTVEDARLLIDFADTGIGISEPDQLRIFERFFRATDPRVGEIEGTGLGLALSREVIRMHGGDITATSALDQGSTFTVELPAVVTEGVAA
jgi:PAS domain S-box-containing protein